MADRGYEAWYERVRESDDIAADDITGTPAEQVLKEFQDYEPSQKQVSEIAERQKVEDIDDANQRNTVSTDKQASLDDDTAYRPSDTEDTFVSVRNKPDIAADRIEGSYTYNGTKYVRVDGKIYGAVDE